ncbi:MAG: DNA primase noncatalytic subunit PriX [Candidatus Micrarchaeota archaeon]|nr:DNA primase noncatalytic subunit PriX [Candidatus Micrarchaeota archaeon]
MGYEAVNQEELDFAYRYPFSKEARGIIAQSGGGFDERFARAGAVRVEEDLNRADQSMPSTPISSMRYTYLLSYVYSRMIISAINSPYHTKRYAHEEAVRARKALEADTFDRTMRIFTELGMPMGYMDGMFTMRFESYLAFAPKGEGSSLIHQGLDKGVVYIDKAGAARVAEGAIEKAVLKNLPIRQAELPKEISRYAKQVRLPAIRTGPLFDKGAKGRYAWIEKVLATPIADVRHRTVNLVLAPYLTNVRGMGEDEAADIINAYIERCKEINPETKITPAYVKYQCRYAKAKGMRPLSLENARELYRGVLDLA